METQAIYLELLALTQLYLKQEVDSEKVWSSFEQFQFFKRHANHEKKETAKAAAIPGKKVGEPQNGVKEDCSGSGNPEGMTQPWVKEDFAGIAAGQALPITSHSREVAKEKALPPPITNEVKLIKPNERKTDFSDIRTLVEKKCPSIKILPHPSENILEAILLYDESSKEHLPFLTSIGKAIQDLKITTEIHPIDFIEKPKFFSLISNLRCLILTRSAFEMSPFLKENGQQQEAKYTLKGIPIVILNDPKSYQENSSKKKALWMEIKRSLS